MRTPRSRSSSSRQYGAGRAGRDRRPVRLRNLCFESYELLPRLVRVFLFSKALSNSFTASPLLSSPFQPYVMLTSGLTGIRTQHSAFDFASPRRLSWPSSLCLCLCLCLHFSSRPLSPLDVRHSSTPRRTTCRGGPLDVRLFPSFKSHSLVDVNRRRDGRRVYTSVASYARTARGPLSRAHCVGFQRVSIALIPVYCSLVVT